MTDQIHISLYQSESLLQISRPIISIIGGEQQLIDGGGGHWDTDTDMCDCLTPLTWSYYYVLLIDTHHTHITYYYIFVEI